MENNPEHDFNTPIEKTTVALARVILDELNKNSEDLIFEVKKDATKEEVQAREEKFYDFCTGIMKTIAASDIPFDYATYPIERLLKFLNTAHSQIGGKIREIEDETLARLYGARNPMNGKFRKEIATFGTVLAKHQEVKMATGNKDSDYFDVPEAVDETTASDEHIASPYPDNK